jgi:hypothetical protein
MADSPLIAESCPSEPDLNRLWRQIQANNGTREWLEDKADSHGPYQVLHPALGLLSAFKQPIVVLSEYEPMWDSLLFFNRMQQEGRGRHRLFFIGHPGIGADQHGV